MAETGEKLSMLEIANVQLYTIIVLISFFGFFRRSELSSEVFSGGLDDKVN